MDNMSLSDIAAVTRNANDDGNWGGNGALYIIILFLFVFMGGGLNGWENMGSMPRRQASRRSCTASSSARSTTV